MGPSSACFYVSYFPPKVLIINLRHFYISKGLFFNVFLLFDFDFCFFFYSFKFSLLSTLIAEVDFDLYLHEFDLALLFLPISLLEFAKFFLGEANMLMSPTITGFIFKGDKAFLYLLLEFPVF